jgi:dTDP-4-dehydrorhamnose reductase
MKILLTGKNGQLGQALQTRLRGLDGLGDGLVEVLAVDRTQMNLSNPEFVFVGVYFGGVHMY